jgi:hypothetical protein
MLLLETESTPSQSNNQMVVTELGVRHRKGLLPVLNTNECELCSRQVNNGARLCRTCAEMMQRIGDASRSIKQPTDQLTETAELLKKKRDRAQAKAEGLTPIILG